MRTHESSSSQRSQLLQCILMFYNVCTGTSMDMTEQIGSQCTQICQIRQQQPATRTPANCRCLQHRNNGTERGDNCCAAVSKFGTSIATRRCFSRPTRLVPRLTWLHDTRRRTQTRCPKHASAMNSGTTLLALLPLCTALLMMDLDSYTSLRT